MFFFTNQYLFSHFNYFLTRINRQRVRDLRTEAVHCRDLSRVKNQKVAEKERESRRMHEEAVRVGKHADKLKRHRANSLQEIESKLRLL